MKTSTTRFSDRVDDYVKYRPHYPQQLVEILADKIGFTTSAIVADIGSGTGISTELFLNNGNRVYAVEPNKEMREAAEKSFSENKNFVSINGTAEKTNLPDESIDVIFSAQAFHWFNKELTRTEFKRILRPNGHIVLAWNIRRENDDLHAEYESILRQLPEYNEVSHRRVTEDQLTIFFSPKEMHQENLENSQVLTLEGLKGRLRSCSYFPKIGFEYERLINEAEKLFFKFERGNEIRFMYDTKIYWC